MKFLISVLACVSIGFCSDEELHQKSNEVTSLAVSSLAVSSNHGPTKSLQSVPSENSSPTQGVGGNPTNADPTAGGDDNIFASPPRRHVIQVPVKQIARDPSDTVET